MTAAPLPPSSGTPGFATLGEIMNAGQRAFGPNWTAEVREFTRKQGKLALRAWGKVRASTAKKTRRGRLYFYEHKFAVRFCALLLSRRREPKPVAARREAKPLTLTEARALADRVFLRKPSQETVRVVARAKPEGGVRPTCSYGPVDRARQRVAADLLELIWGQSPFEFARKGRGRDAAIRVALDARNKGGVERFVRTDLKDFYPSVNRGELVKLVPLPTAITANTILIPDTQKIITKGTTPSEATVRAGLPMGSRSSPVVASKIIQSLIHDLPGARVALSHGDDVLIGVRRSGVEGVKNALVSRAAEHPAGPFSLKMLDVIELGKPNDYLGYEFRHRKMSDGGGARVAASRKAMRRFQRRVARSAYMLPLSARFEMFERSSDHWAESFRQWDGRKGAAGIAAVELANEVSPALMAFDWYVSRAKRRFKSFPEIADFFDRVFLSFVGGDAAAKSAVYKILDAAWRLAAGPGAYQPSLLHGQAKDGASAS